MNWRSDIILNESTGLFGLFNRYKAGGAYDGDPIRLNTVAPAFSLAVKSKNENLPAVSFGFGNNRGLEAGTTEGTSGRFNIYVYAEVNKTADKTIIERAGDMYSCVEEVVRSLRTFSPAGVDINNVRISDMRTPETKLSEKEFMLFVLSVEFEEYFDEVM